MKNSQEQVKATKNTDRGTALEIHSPTGASSMHRWEACPGSIRLCKGLPNVSSAYADEGTRAHAILANFLTLGEFPKDADAETCKAVMVFIDAVFQDERSGLAKDGVKKWVEHGFDLSALHAGLYGTADYVAYYPTAKLLQVWDYKHGQGIPVEPKENEQLMYYGLGALLTLEMPEGVQNVELIIGQPRREHKDGPIRRWTTTAKYLTGPFADRLVLAKKATEHPNAILKAGDHCRFCPAGRAGVCSEIHNKALRLAQNEFATPPTGEMTGYDAKKFAEILDWLPTFSAWVTSMEEFAELELKAGRGIPGYKLVQTKGHRKWKPGLEVDALSLELGVNPDQLIEEKLISPAQVEKLLGKKERPLLDQLTTTGSGGVTIAKADDPRPNALVEAAVEFKAHAVIEASYSMLD